METANLLNKVHPKNIWCLKLLLSNLNAKDCFFEDTTVLDSYTIRGMLPEQKEELLNAMDTLIDLHR